MSQMTHLFISNNPCELNHSSSMSRKRLEQTSNTGDLLMTHHKQGQTKRKEPASETMYYALCDKLGVESQYEAVGSTDLFQWRGTLNWLEDRLHNDFFKIATTCYSSRVNSRVFDDCKTPVFIPYKGCRHIKHLFGSMRNSTGKSFSPELQHVAYYLQTLLCLTLIKNSSSSFNFHSFPEMFSLFRDVSILQEYFILQLNMIGYLHHALLIVDLCQLAINYLSWQIPDAVEHMRPSRQVSLVMMISTEVLGYFIDSASNAQILHDAMEYSIDEVIDEFFDMTTPSSRLEYVNIDVWPVLKMKLLEGGFPVMKARSIIDVLFEKKHCEWRKSLENAKYLNAYDDNKVVRNGTSLFENLMKDGRFTPLCYKIDAGLETGILMFDTSNLYNLRFATITDQALPAFKYNCKREVDEIKEYLSKNRSTITRLREANGYLPDPEQSQHFEVRVSNPIKDITYSRRLSDFSDEELTELQKISTLAQLLEYPW